MVIRILKSNIHKLLPSMYQSLYQHRKQRQRTSELVAQAKELVQATQTANIPAKVNRIVASKVFQATQRPQEIISLLELLADHQPRVICEIGCARGGTLFLWCQVAAPNAFIVSIDLTLDSQRTKAYRYFRQEKQHLVFIRGDSHSGATFECLKQVLDGRQLDLLFIDGDHSYEGVKSDYEKYSTLVRSKGLIVFHDIVPDFEIRYGIQTDAYAGGVPRFWQELKQQNSSACEFIENPDQDGFGLGLIERV